MSEQTVVPVLNAAARSASEAMAEHKRGATEQDGEIGVVENLLRALEGMQIQLQAVTELVIEQDKRIERLEKSRPGRIITGGNQTMSKLTSKGRNRLAGSKFAGPDRSYPVNDHAHAANAKARATQAVKAGRMTQSERERIDAKANRVLGEKLEKRISKRNDY